VAIDPDGCTLGLFKGCGRLVYPVATEERDILAVLNRVKDEMERRKELYQGLGVDKIERFNLKSDENLRRIAVVIDEGTSLFEEPQVCGAVETLALRGRKYGIHLITAAPMWQTTNVSKRIRAPLATRICFRVESESESRVILNHVAGAEKLTAPGRCLVNMPGRMVMELQAPIVSENYIEEAFEDGAGAVCEMPQGVDLERDLLIANLSKQGLSKRQIAKQIFGYTGGYAFNEVSRVLAGHSLAGGAR